MQLAMNELTMNKLAMNGIAMNKLAMNELDIYVLARMHRFAMTLLEDHRKVFLLFTFLSIANTYTLFSFIFLHSFFLYFA